MPGGGISGSGTGLRLQSTTPGVTDDGNAHISGAMLATVFATPDITHSPGVNTENLLIGQGISNRYDPNDNSTGSENCLIGNYITNGFNYGGIKSRSQWNTLVGTGSKSAYWGCVALGRFAVAGNTEADYDSFNNYSMAIGFQAYANGGSICMATASGTCSGRNSTLISPFSNASNNANYSFVCGNVSTHAAANILVIWPGAAKLNMSAADSNSIIIGDSSHVNVRIGPYTIGQSSGASTKINDQNVVLVGATYGTIIYTTITAARTVALPAANSVPVGFRITISDFSGNCSALMTITAIPTGTDTIPYGNALNNSYDTHEFMSDGISQWVQTLDTR